MCVCVFCMYVWQIQGTSGGTFSSRVHGKFLSSWYALEPPSHHKHSLCVQICRIYLDSLNSVERIYIGSQPEFRADDDIVLLPHCSSSVSSLFLILYIRIVCLCLNMFVLVLRRETAAFFASSELNENVFLGIKWHQFADFWRRDVEN